ncbi:MAG: hypothetical protein COC06_08055 [Bacteroidales bacterium]|nr:MAG: hypothetical protein COC06_08055 [Bacteroidales bacterium]
MNPDKDLSEIKNSYNLKEVADIPENIQAIEFDNVSELEVFLKSMKKKKHYKMSGTTNRVNLLNFTNQKLDEYLPRLKSTGTESGNMDGHPSGWWFQDLDINIYWGNAGDNDALNINSQMDGFTFSVGYTQDGYSASWNSSNDTINFHIDGSESYYVIIQGIGHVYTNDVEVNGWYKPSTGNYYLDINN